MHEIEQPEKLCAQKPGFFGRRRSLLVSGARGALAAVTKVRTTIRPPEAISHPARGDC